MDAFRLDGRVAVITGGAAGIGAATAELFVRAGAKVVVLDIDAPAAQRTAARLGGQVRAIGGAQADITSEAAVERAMGSVRDVEGRLDILVNNAGSAIRAPAFEVSLADWQRVIDLNLTATFVCARSAARRMPADGGAIVNLASIMSFSGGIYPNASYQASKGAVLNLTRALALEWAQRNVRVNAVAPTYVRTQLTQAIFSDAGRTAKVMEHTPLGRLPEPIDIARAILFLASPAARCVTGITVPVDSGFLAM